MTPLIEIVAIGTELLKGSIINTNGAEIAKALTEAGFISLRQTILPDEKIALKNGLMEALQRNAIVIATGGLGPTCDDLTRQVAAEIYGSTFEFNEELAEDLKKRYGNASASIADQASVPSKAILLNNPIGTAAGLVFSDEKSTLILMPGVPKEMRAMLHEQTIPFLCRKYAPSAPPKNLTYHFFGLSESFVDPLLRQLEKSYPDIEFGIYPSHGVLTVSATECHRALKRNGQLSAALDQLKERFQQNYYGANGKKLEELIQYLFIQKGWTLATAESCTGGAIASRLTKIAGASNYFKGGVVSYSNELKESFLEVPSDVIETFGAVSEETVKAMAEGIVRRAGVDFGLSVSGVAGPAGGTDERPVGTVWIGIAGKDKVTSTHKVRGYGNREMIIETAVNLALGLLLKFAERAAAGPV